jgi:hypothetical protein
MRILFRALFVGIVAGLFSYTATLPAYADAKRFCVVAVKNGKPTEKDVNQAHRLIFRVETFPGVPRPIIYPSNRGGVWTVDDDGAFVQFGGAFPSNWLHDKFAFETHSGRVIGLNTYPEFFHRIWALHPNTTAFQEIPVEDVKRFGGLSSLRYVPRLKATAFGNRNGLFILRNDKIEIVPGGSEKAGWVTGIFDLPEYEALILNIEKKGIYVLERDGTLREIGKPVARNYAQGVIDKGGGTAWIDARNEKFVTDFRRDEKGVFRLHAVRHELPGDQKTRDVLKRIGAPERTDQVKVWAIGRGILSSKDGRVLHLSTGKEDIELEDSKAANFGQVWRIKDHEVIGRTIIYTSSGLFELRPDNMLMRISENLGEALHGFIEWPQLKVVVVLTEKKGVYVIAESGGAKMPDGGEIDALVFTKPIMMPTRDEIVITARNGLYLIVNRNKHPSRCAQ